MDSKIGLIIQLNGVILITILSLCLRRSLQLTALKYWTMAWLCQSFALICLRLAFSYEDFSVFLFPYYFLAEYLFGFLLIAGCRSLDGTYEIKPWSELFAIPLIAAAIILPQVAPDFNDVFSIHALFLAGFYGVGLFFLRRSKQVNFGWRVMHVSLSLLTLELLLYPVVFSLRNFIALPVDLLSYNPVIHVVLQTALGLGMVIILLEKVLGDAKTANEQLISTQKRLEELVHTDPLTEAFNRHAFYGYMRKQGESQTASTGCVGFFDIDDLKAVNDCFGHASGDMVIRAVVRSIREIIRAEDLIYRWGGDEFFVIMVGMDAEMAETRMERLDSLLAHVYIDNLPEPVRVGVSCGFTNYADSNDLENAIKMADTAMYRRKQVRKQSNAASIDSTNSLPGQTVGFPS